MVSYMTPIRFAASKMQRSPPTACSVLRLLRNKQVPRAEPLENLLNLFHGMLKILFAISIKLDKNVRSSSIEHDFLIEVSLRESNGRVIHEFDGSGNNLFPNDLGNRFSSGCKPIEGRKQINLHLCFGISRRMIFVTMARVPSDPTRS